MEWGRWFCYIFYVYWLTMMARKHLLSLCADTISIFRTKDEEWISFGFRKNTLPMGWY